MTGKIVSNTIPCIVSQDMSQLLNVIKNTKRFAKISTIAYHWSQLYLTSYISPNLDPVYVVVEVKME